MINRVYKLVLFLLNKENKGYISPEEFNELADKVQMQIITNLFVEHNKAAIRTNRGTNNVNIIDNELTINQRLSHLTTIKELELITERRHSLLKLPSDCWFLISNGVLFYPDNDSEPTMIERLDISKRSTLLSNQFIYDEFPVYFQNNERLEIYPILNGHVEVSYLRKPRKPKWTYRMIRVSPTSSETTPMFDESDPLFQDFDLHESDFTSVVMRMLPELGLSLRERDVIDYGEKLKQDDEMSNIYQPYQQ